MILIETLHLIQTHYQIAHFWYECQEAERHRIGWEKFEPIEGGVCWIEFILAPLAWKK